MIRMSPLGPRRAASTRCTEEREREREKEIEREREREIEGKRGRGRDREGEGGRERSRASERGAPGGSLARLLSVFVSLSLALFFDDHTQGHTMALV